MDETTDGQVTVQDGAVSTAPAEGAASEQVPSTPAIDEKTIADLVAKAVAKHTSELEAKSQQALRDMQSQKDRAIAEMQRRAQLAEAALNSLRSRVAQQSPELVEPLDVEVLRSRVAMYEEQERQRQQAEAMQRVINDFRSEMSEFIKDHDIAENDPEYLAIIEEAIKTNQLGAGSRKIHKLVAERNKAMKASLEKRIQEEVAKALKQQKAESNSVDTNNPVGTPVSSDDVFLRDFADGKLPMSDANIKRFRKLTGG